MLRDFETTQIDHNDFDCGDRGKWRKYNPYNPYTGDENKSEQNKDVKVESLDDLFEDVPPANQTAQPANNMNNQVNANINPIANLNQEGNNNFANNSLGNMTNQNSSVLPGFEDEVTSQMQEIPEDEIDIQKELEAKFDELFGSD